jgi:peptidyl-prolyl cis-trans isomerase C
MRRFDPLRMWFAACALTAGLAVETAFAQLPSSQQLSSPVGTDPSGTSLLHAPLGAGSDPVVGSVDGKLVYLSDLTRVVNTLPEQMRDMPFESVMPVLLDRIIDHEALTLQARRASLDKRPDVQRDMRAAADQVLERAWLAQVIPPIVTEAAIRARYNRQYANRPATDEVHARHILVGTEGEAKNVITELKGGADFASIARVVSKDPDGKQGGDLGFFRRDQVWPGFADLAFSLQPGQVGANPVHNEFGWHVVKIEERRLVAPPTLSEIHDQIKQELTEQAVRATIAAARGQMIIHKFNLDGSEIDASPRLSSEGAERQP